MTEVKTGTVTWNTTNKLSGTASIHKIGRICQLELDAVSYSSIHHGDVVLTVPTEFKPLTSVWLPVTMTSSTLSASTDWVTFPLQLRTDGKVYIFSTTSGASARLSAAKATLTYISAT